MRTVEADICVIGAGPAGCAAAQRLARLGYQVVITEQSKFPRPRIGESLAPSILPLLEALDVRTTVEEAGFLRPTHTRVNWSSEGTVVTSLGREPGFHVDRGRFDTLLLEHAERSGAVVIQPARAGRPTRSGGGRWLIPLGDKAVEVRAFVDATGRKTGRGHAPRTVAVWAYWRGVEPPDRLACIEAGSESWCWGVPLPGDLFNAVAFSDFSRGAAAGYRDRLGRSSLLRHCLSGTIDGRIRGCDATSYAVNDPIGPDYVRVGEASYAIDPLSSQGVQHALTSALGGSAALHTLLSASGDSEAAIEFYRASQSAAVALSARTAATVYAREDRFGAESFWRLRATPAPPSPQAPARRPVPADIPLRLSPAAAIVDTPVIDGDMIRRMPAVHHSAFARPVAFLGGVALAPLLSSLRPIRSARELVSDWSMAGEDAWRIVEWLWHAEILEAAA